MTREEFSAIANRFTKKQLIATVSEIVSGWDLFSIASALTTKQASSILDAIDAVSNEYISVLEDISQWTKDMAAKYGDGNKFNLLLLTQSELQAGAALENKARTLQDRERRLQRQFDKMTEVQNGKT